MVITSPSAVFLSTASFSNRCCLTLPRHAFTDVGFWVVTGTGFTEEEIEHQFAIGQAFYNLPLEERNLNRCDLANGGYFGYRGVSRHRDSN